MSSESDNLGSSSESETSSDEDMDRNIIKAFNAVKSNLDKSGLKNKNATIVNSATSSRHNLIYDTFKKRENVIPKKKSNKKPSDAKEANSFLNKFFIDKNDDSIVAYDLSNFNFDSGEDELDKTISYDLTNSCDIVNDQGTENSMSDDDGQESEKQEEDVADNEKKSKKKRMKKKKQNGILSSTLNADVALTDVYVDVNPLGKVKSHKKGNEVQQRHAEPEIMKKSVISDDYEKQDTIQTTHVSVRQQKKERRLEREKTKGSKWFNMPATELTEERKYDLAVLQMRKVLDPKRFYKSHDLKAVPKYFQFGEVVEDATDFYSSRIPKKQRKSTVVEELLADAEFRKFNKRKYEEVQEAKRHGKGPYKHMKRLKKRKK